MWGSSGGGVILNLIIIINHGLIATACLSSVAVHPFIATIYQSANGYFQDENTPG